MTNTAVKRKNRGKNTRSSGCSIRWRESRPTSVGKWKKGVHRPRKQVEEVMMWEVPFRHWPDCFTWNNHLNNPTGRIKSITSSTWTIKSNVEDHQILQITKVQKVNFGNTTHTRIGRDALDDLILAAIKTKWNCGCKTKEKMAEWGKRGKSKKRRPSWIFLVLSTPPPFCFSPRHHPPGFFFCFHANKVDGEEEERDTIRKNKIVREQSNLNKKMSLSPKTK